MSKAHAVAQHLPYLRRYARALTGNQASGDAYVAATLEALVKDPDLLESSYPPRVTLFQLFSTIWNSLSVNETIEPATNPGAPERHLSQITAKPRQAFLLISVEGFPEEHAARILDVDIPALRRLLDESSRQLAAQIATDVLIIEDEALIALDRRRTHAKRGSGDRTEQTSRIDPRRHPARRRKLRARRRQRSPQHVRSPGHLHHRLSRALPDRRAAGAGVPCLQALSAGDGFSPGKPGPLL
jgi:DNA-directed RNA polymerase specialized sigma24 family protein